MRLEKVDEIDSKRHDSRRLGLLYSFFIRYNSAMPQAAPASPGKLIYLGACLIAAVRLAREEHWDNSPRIVSRIGDSVFLAQKIWERVRREFPQMFAG